MANEIQDDTKKRAILLSACGAKIYKLFKGLIDPEKPSTVSFINLIQTMKKHQSPTPNQIAERFNFNIRDRTETESVSSYVVELRRLTQHCDFGTALQDMIRDRLVCGIRNVKIQQRLLFHKTVIRNSKLSTKTFNRIRGASAKNQFFVNREIGRIIVRLLPLWRPPYRN